MSNITPLRETSYESTQWKLECMLVAAEELVSRKDFVALEITVEELIKMFRSFSEDEAKKGNFLHDFTQSFWGRMAQVAISQEEIVEKVVKELTCGVQDRRWKTYFLWHVILALLSEMRIEEALPLVPKLEFRQNSAKVKIVEALSKRGKPEDLECALQFFSQVKGDGHYRVICLKALARTDLTEMDEEELQKITDSETVFIFKEAVSKIRKLMNTNAA